MGKRRQNNYLPTLEEIEQRKLEIRLDNEAGRYVMNEDEEDDLMEESRMYQIRYNVAPDSDNCCVQLSARSKNDAIIRFRLQGNFYASILGVEELRDAQRT